MPPARETSRPRSTASVVAFLTLRRLWEAVGRSGPKARLPNAGGRVCGVHAPETSQLLAEARFRQESCAAHSRPSPRSPWSPSVASSPTSTPPPPMRRSRAGQAHPYRRTHFRPLRPEITLAIPPNDPSAVFYAYTAAGEVLQAVFERTKNAGSSQIDPGDLSKRRHLSTPRNSEHRTKSVGLRARRAGERRRHLDDRSS